MSTPLVFDPTRQRILIVGGSGFIGSHMCRKWNADSYDLLEGNDAHDLTRLVDAMRDYEMVVHLASNADIAAGATNPTIDFNEGTVLTQNVCEAVRINDIKTLVYASGSGVYGKPIGGQTFTEKHPSRPSSPYGASKVAGEALVSAYSAMYGIRGLSFRFANVVGPGQTHGVGFDFLNKLRMNPARLEIMGDGKQNKQYIGVDEVINGVEVALAFAKKPGAYNVAPHPWQGRLTVFEVAQMASDVLRANPQYVYVPGWSGDVPKITLSPSKLTMLGWRPHRNSREAMQWALENL